MDLDRQWRIRDLLAEVLATAYARHGTTAREQDVIVDTDKAGGVTLRRRTVGHEAARTPQDGGPAVIKAVDHEDAGKLAQAVGRFADLHMALAARDRCLNDLGIGYDQVPPWSVMADSLLVDVATRAGWDMAELCRLSTSGGQSVADENGFELAAPDQFAVQAGGRTYLATIMRGWLSGGVIGHPFKIRCGADGATTYDGKRRPTLTIMDQMLPDTLIAALGGRRLADVVTHPVLERSEAVISSVANVPGSVPRIDIRLRRRRVPLAPPPEGVDAGWLTTISELSS